MMLREFTSANGGSRVGDHWWATDATVNNDCGQRIKPLRMASRYETARCSSRGAGAPHALTPRRPKAATPAEIGRD
jgi:hypothetical protein